MKRLGEFGRLGSTVEYPQPLAHFPTFSHTDRDRFFDAIWKEYGTTHYTVVEVSQRSVDKTGSSWTACVYEIALGTTDVCVADYWTTPARRALGDRVSFSTAVYQTKSAFTTLQTINVWVLLWKLHQLLDIYPALAHHRNIWKFSFVACTACTPCTHMANTL